MLKLRSGRLRQLLLPMLLLCSLSSSLRGCLFDSRSARLVPEWYRQSVDSSIVNLTIFGQNFRLAKNALGDHSASRRTIADI
jgi:hypothetical protein